MNGARGWGPPQDRSPSGCPGSLTFKKLQESGMIRMSLRNASLTESYQFSADFILVHSEEAAKEELRRLEKHLTTSSKCWPAPSFPCLHQSLHYRSECLQWRTKNGVVPRAGWSSQANIICKLCSKRGWKEHGELFSQKAAWTPRSQVGAVTEKFWARVPDLLHVYSTDR